MNSIVKYFLIPSLILLFVCCQENIEIRFKDKTEIVDANYIGKGWVPLIIPDDCYDITVVNNLDNNHFFGVFSFRGKSFTNYFASLEIGYDSLYSKLKSINIPNPPEWFIDNEVLKDKKNLLFRKYSYFYMIIDTINKKCFYFG